MIKPQGELYIHQPNWYDDGEFFNYIQSDYVAYEEDMYYETH